MDAYKKYKMANIDGKFDPKQLKEVEEKPKKMSEEYVAQLNDKSSETGILYKKVKVEEPKND